jgi:L-cysteine S-thiosulfotransferase
MRTIIALAVLAVAAPAVAQEVDAARVEAAIAASWPGLSDDLQQRLVPDETLAACSEHRDMPPPDVADAILARERASIVYPADGVLMGDWQVGLKEANNGWGGRMRDDDPQRVNGGNCYACHQLAPDEVAYGNLGPSLTGYGAGGVDDDFVKATYDKIYNSQAVLACSNMPRFGANGFLTPEQIRDFVAMLLHPDSPVNQ